MLPKLTYLHPQNKSDPVVKLALKYELSAQKDKDGAEMNGPH